MAATVRVTGTVPVLGLGAFGSRVAELLCDGIVGAYRIGPDDLAGSFARRPAAVVVAAPHPMPEVCRSADRAAWQHGVPWLPVVDEDLTVRLGPWVVPGAGPCFDCYLARRVQHDDQSAITAAVRAACADDPACGPRGFLPQHARAAAGVAHGLLHQPPDPGTVVALSVRSGNLDSHRVLHCHGCPRCAPGSVPGLDRTGALAELLRPAGGTTPYGVPA
ncbi:TOMM precursor leader peptide-binding protein [Streptomyces sp. NBC_00932]|uniref:TOMM precursor leader peptide-binding protein n=1 Tax=Streptomyces sp. NBC_00932 TaxID=2903690 RepID=UPI00386E5A61|nr:TOMM precursor leader peptide-binding protein [Streptomyces sp. NBC_00932]